MKTSTKIGLMAAGLAVAASSPATAAVISIDPKDGAAFTITDSGGCGAGGCVPVGLSGYISGGVGAGGSAPTMSVTPGDYSFTYLGNGDAGDHDTFTITVGPNVIHWNDAVGTSFTYSVGAGGVVPFVYTNLTTGQSIADGDVSPNQKLAYGLFGVSPGLAYIGLTDLPYPGDHDFQDLGIKVSAIPEPATWALMLLGFSGLGYAAFRCAKRDSVFASA
jgi:hypothetical protein